MLALALLEGGGELELRLQSDLRLYPGFGGGPLIDADGLVLGLNSGGLSGPLATTIPGGTVDQITAQLLQKGSVARGWLGAAMQPVRFTCCSRSSRTRRRRSPDCWWVT